MGTACSKENASKANKHKAMDEDPGNAVKQRSPAKKPSLTSFSLSVQGSDCLGTKAMDPGKFITQKKGHLADMFTYEKKLGTGAYGEVLLCRDKQSGADRAVKKIKKSSLTANRGALLDEFEVVKQLDHPNIMKLYEFFEDEHNFYIVMDVYTGGELFDEIISRQKFTEVDAARVIKQVLSGVTYLHNHHIVHRDLKPENLLLESKAPDALIKIVDFGLSSFFDSKTKMKDKIGTAYYIAPEVLKQKYDEKCDVWSIGVVLYILLCGYPPFNGQTDRDILHKIEKGKFTFDPLDWTSVSDEAKDLVSLMLTLDPDKRISPDQCLRHRWIEEVTRKEKEAVKEPLLLNALNNMKKFQASQKLAQAAFYFIGAKLTTMEETKELTKIFRSLDRNADGQLDRGELIRGYEELMMMKGENVGMTHENIEQEVDKILEMVDFDQNGYIEYSEFVTVALDKNILLSRDRLKQAFELFDQDHSGTIAASELRRLMSDVDDDQWKAIIDEVDSNKNGEVDFDEFVEMMQKVGGRNFRGDRSGAGD